MNSDSSPADGSSDPPAEDHLPEAGERAAAASDSQQETVPTYQLAEESPLQANPDMATIVPGVAAVVEPVAPAPRAKPRRRSTFWFLTGCNLMVFASSLCIMVLELTASRLIARHVGSSLYTWTSVIGVVLAGITVGNWLGGWLADRFELSRLPGILFLVASMLSFSILLTDSLAASVPRPAGWQWSAWILTVVVCLFLLPAVSLGTISPVVACLALSRSSRTGMTVGNVYAWGAMGSIAGTFLTGFYLIDLAGSKAIIVLTSAALAVIGLCVSGGRRAFQAVVLLGWMQLLLVCGLLATASSDWLPEGEATAAMHRLGLAVGLRRDEPGAYYDESNYSSIQVGETTADGDRVRYLKLDKLIHSYFNPRNPAALYYDYEFIYAAATERAAADWNRPTAVPVDLSDADQPESEDTPLTELTAALPAGVAYDAASGELRATGALTGEQRRALLQQSGAAPLWEALQTLHWITTRPGWGGFTAVPVDAVPEGFAVPESLREIVQYDSILGQLTAWAMVDDRVLGEVISAGPDAGWYRAVDRLYRQSRRTSALFIGGGGFIFPRWVEQQFPEEPKIVVAELDPAVLAAVTDELDLDPQGRIARNTRIGDARNVVEELVRENRLAENEGLPVPHRFDFVYGDAFNDFSVPWHLTTREFCERIDSLLADDGVYLVNIIDAYPRTEFPAKLHGRAETTYHGAVPEGLLEQPLQGTGWVLAGGEFGRLEIRSTGRDTYRLRYEAIVPESVLDQLLQVAGDDSKFAEAAGLLYRQSRRQLPTEFAIPGELIPTGLQEKDRWYPCGPAYSGLEILSVKEPRGPTPVVAPRPGQQSLTKEVQSPAGADGPSSTAERYALAVRGSMSDELFRALRALEPRNREWQAAVTSLYRGSQAARAGRFLASYVHTVGQVFPHVAVFSSEPGGYPDDQRDTFVIACSRQPLRLDDLEYHETATDGQQARKWYGRPFATRIVSSATGDGPGKTTTTGLMQPLLDHAGGLTLTDDYAPVDNLLIPVFTRQN